MKRNEIPSGRLTAATIKNPSLKNKLIGKQEKKIIRDDGSVISDSSSISSDSSGSSDSSSGSSNNSLLEQIGIKNY